MTKDRKPDDLRDLDSRLQQARKAADKPAHKGSSGSNDRSGINIAMRMGVEMISALIVGVAIGYFLDRWLGTKPWLMLLFFVLGSAAGFLGVYRAATGLGQTVGYRQDKRETQSDDKNSTGSDPSP